MADTGFDTSTFVDGDLDPFFRPITGARAIAERVARRYRTRRGRAPYAPDDGLDLVDYLSGGLDPSRTYGLEALLVDQAEKDEGVLAASAKVTVNEAAQTIRAKVLLQTSDGPLPLTLEISKLEVSVVFGIET
jgi:hypothetical protein